MRLSTKARYGLRALCHVAHRGYASAQVIAEHQAIPSRYLEEIIGELRRAGFVVGKRGPRGGYRLAKPPAEIAVSDVLRALSGGPGSSTGEPQDEITALVERSVPPESVEELARGVAMSPVDHPHGGGEGRTGEARPQVSPWNTLTKGYRTRNNKRTQTMIVSRRKK